MGKFDKLGRAAVHHIAAQGGVQPTNRALRWMNHIAHHGPQSSVYFHELTCDTHRCKDTALRDLQRLLAGGLLFLPPQQRQVERAEFNPYIYDLTERGKAVLRDQGFTVPPRPIYGHWQHQYPTACVTGSIDIAAARDGVRYVPQHEILARKGATLGVPVNGTLLMPDQLFALDYGGRYRAFVLEVDCRADPVGSRAARKSLIQSIALYQAALQNDQLRRHFGLTAPVLVLWAFTLHSRAHWFIDHLRKQGCDRTMPMFGQLICADGPEQNRPMIGLYDQAWHGAQTSLSISRAAPTGEGTSRVNHPAPDKNR